MPARALALAKSKPTSDLFTSQLYPIGNIPDGYRALAGLFREVGDHSQLFFSLLVVRQHGPDDQRVYAGVTELADLGLRSVRRPHDRHQVDELVRQREHGLCLLPR